MADQSLDKTTQHIQTGFDAVRVKLHLDEVASSIIEVISEFHQHVAHFIEAATKKIPLINLLIDAIGNVAAIVTIRQKKAAFEKRALGVKVTAGLITGAMTIAAFAAPHVAIPLVVIGSISSVSYSVFSIYKTKRRLNKLETELNQLNPEATAEHHELQQNITELKLEIKEQNHEIIHKSVKTITSTIALVGAIIMLANPVTVIPVSIILAATAVTYTAYHFRKPISKAFKRVGRAIKNVFTPANNDISQLQDKDVDTHQQQQTAMVQPVADFLQTQQHVLSEGIAAHHQTFEQQHNEEHIQDQANEPVPRPEPTKAVKPEEEEEDGGSAGSGIPAPPELML